MQFLYIELRTFRVAIRKQSVKYPAFIQFFTRGAATPEKLVSKKPPLKCKCVSSEVCVCVCERERERERERGERERGEIGR